MKKIIVVLGLVILLGAGIAAWGHARTSVDDASAGIGTYTYRCGDGTEFAATFASDMKTVHIKPTTNVDHVPAVTLSSAATTSGVLFRNGTVSFAGRGETVALMMGTSTTDCSQEHASDEAPFNFGD